VAARVELDEMWEVFEEVYALSVQLSPSPSLGEGRASGEREEVAIAASRLFHRCEIPLERARDFF